jgi:flagellar biosynthesis/type III secretory pathway chaperone
MKNPIFIRLNQILNEEYKLYSQIFEISKEKTDIIIEGKVKELERITNLEQSIVFKLGKLEGIREEISVALAGSMKLDPEKVRLEDLEKGLGENATELRETQGKLVNLIKKIGEKNELNKKLLENSLDYVNFSINLFSQVESDGNKYGKDGSVKDSPKKKARFDMKL